MAEPFALLAASSVCPARASLRGMASAQGEFPQQAVTGDTKLELYLLDVLSLHLELLP